MNETTKDILERVATWPQEDQEELAEIAQEIEGRRSGIYVLNDDEKVAIEAARRGDFASSHEVAEFWKRHGSK